MASLRLSSIDLQEEHRQGLCPDCLSRRVHIRSHVEVEYEVEATASHDEIQVVDERLSGSGWDDGDDVLCPACGWTGRVSDLMR